MQSKFFNLAKLISLRREIHFFPETAFQEIKTSERIINFLIGLGIDLKAITKKAKTGLVIDIKGKGPTSGKPKMIAFRADMDALPMTEDNPHLEYKSSVNNAAHMCGHDGHIVCLLGGISKILESLDKIPADRTVRLLFQPAEEAGVIGGGAKPMIEEGCLDGVDEVYGAHNMPIYPLGTIVVKEGPMMAEGTHIKITFIGKGGHGSAPQKANDPLQPAVDFHVKLRDLNKKYQDQGKNFVCVLPLLHVGEAENVIAERALIKGLLRSLDSDFTIEYKAQLVKILDEICDKYKCKVEYTFFTSYPVLINTKIEAEHVERVSKIVYGDENVTSEGAPIYASEDFSYFTQKVPGAFFFVGTWDKNKNSDPYMLHSNHYDFNDDAIEKMSELWAKLAVDRLEYNME